MSRKYTREGYRERAQALGRLQYRLFGEGSGKPAQLGPMRGRRLLMYAIPAMALLIIASRFLEPAVRERVLPLEETPGTIFAKQGPSEGEPDEEYLLGVRLTLDDGSEFEEVVAVDAEFWHKVNIGGTVTVRYRRNAETDGVDLRIVLVPAAAP